MTRKEQIDQAVNSTYPSSHDSVSRVAFRRGIRWAEDNPNHEAFNTRLKLEKEEWMDKAWEWVFRNTDIPVEGLKYFKKHMEDK